MGKLLRLTVDIREVEKLVVKQVARVPGSYMQKSKRLSKVCFGSDSVEEDEVEKEEVEE